VAGLRRRGVDVVSASDQGLLGAPDRRQVEHAIAVARVALPMKRSPVHSSMMVSVGYDASHFILEIEFRSGHVYRYFAVPLSVFQGLLNAASIGRFFHAEIDRVYPVEMVRSLPAHGRPAKL
jgi:KTSC domain